MVNLFLIIILILFIINCLVDISAKQYTIFILNMIMVLYNLYVLLFDGDITIFSYIIGLIYLLAFIANIIARKQSAIIVTGIIVIFAVYIALYH